MGPKLSVSNNSSEGYKRFEGWWEAERRERKGDKIAKLCKITPCWSNDRARCELSCPPPPPVAFAPSYRYRPSRFQHPGVKGAQPLANSIMHFRRVIRVAEKRKRESGRASESFDSSGLRLQRRKSETEFPCRVYLPADLDERCASEIRLNSENAGVGYLSTIVAFSEEFTLPFRLWRYGNRNSICKEIIHIYIYLSF